MTLPRFTFTERATPWLQIGVGDTRLATGLGRWNVSRWDGTTARWASTEPSWLDVSCEAFRCRCEYGRRRSTDRFVPGVATIEVSNASGWADPLATSDPSVLTMRPGRAIRFGVDHVALGRVVLWRGFIDSVTPTYDPTVTDSATFQCVDALGDVNRARIAEQPDSPEQTANQRIRAVLDLALWPTDRSRLDASSVPLVADALNGQVADLLGRAADSAGGSVFGDREGFVVFRARDWQTFPPGTPYEATIGNVEPTDVCPVSWERPFARADIATRAIMGRDADTALVFDDTDGITLYGIEPHERVDLWTRDDVDLTTLGNRALRVLGHTNAPVVRAVTLDAGTSDAAVDVMTMADPYEPTHYRCRLAYDRGLVFDAVHLVTGVVHDMTADRWETAVNLDLAAPYEAVGGRWDQGWWDRSLWASIAALRIEAEALLARAGAPTP
jgi:hypothetical protein